MDKKKCKDCNLEQDIDQFRARPTAKNPKNRDSKCNLCRSALRRAKYIPHPKVIKAQPDSKNCKKCNECKPKERFRLQPTKSNPEWRGNICIDCENLRIRTKLRELGVHKARYDAMTEEERKAYIKKKSEQNKHRLKNNLESYIKVKEYRKSDKAIYIRYVGDCNRRTRLTRGIKMELTFEQFSEIINKPCTYCSLSNASICRR